MNHLRVGWTVFLALSLCCSLMAGPLPEVPPSGVGLDPARLDQIDDAVREAIAKNQTPGAVVLVLRKGKIAFRRAYGLKSKQPVETPMTIDTVFDLASLTKPIATATSVMILIERGKLKLGDKVATHIPEFAQNGKEDITVEQLLLHTSGLIADNSLKDYDDGPAKACERIHALKPTVPPGSKFIYSDVGFMVLGELVERLSGQPLDVFARQHIFEPLNMKETTFKPPEGLSQRAAPTEKRGDAGDRWLQGQVHDPRASRLGGVAGHAGLFSTADDLAVFAQMLLNQGESEGKRVLTPATVELMTEPRAVPNGLRALGWDVQTSYSSNRGELFPVGSFGHTGFTGTSIWIDPSSQTAVIFLSNRVHPDGKGNVNRLRGQVATLAAQAIVPPLPPRLTGCLTGIEVLKRGGFKQLQGRRVGLITNHTGVDREGISTIDLLCKAEGIKLVALFSPEHGIRGQLDQAVGDSKDEKTGLPIYSLYGQRKRPTREQLQGIDTLVFDIQDIGCRFYTYISTLGYILETAAEHKLRVVVLDRPNPIGGVAVEGPVLDAGRESFVAYYRLPVRHGMTAGELARLFNAEKKLGVDLQVVQVQGWRRGQFFDQTGLTWINPSPNMRTLTAALLYPGVGLLETTNLSVGRGTDRPFEVIGAPWLDGQRLAEALRTSPVKGLRFVPVHFTPTGSKFQGQVCGGVQFIVDDWSQIEPLRLGMTLATTLKRQHPTEWETKRYPVLLGHQATFEALENGESPERIMELWKEELAAFREVREKYLLYPP
jgi:uncharacterized protein YbbC (DUF1343 family)